MYAKTSWYCNLHMPNPCPRLEPASGVCGFALDLSVSINSPNISPRTFSFNIPTFSLHVKKNEKLVALSSIVLRVFSSDFQLEF